MKQKIRDIGVIGAGTMGSGIAHIAARNGYKVIIKDIEQEQLEKGINRIKKSLNKMVDKEKLTKSEADKVLDRISTTLDFSDLNDKDFVIEAVNEDIDLKKDIFEDLEEICPEKTIFATNTSGLSISEMASVTKREEKFVGMHFFNPVEVMKLVEVVKGAHTDSETINITRNLANDLGKETIKVKESPLFTVNRILVPMINEAIFVLMKNISSAEDIDKGMKLGANHPIGPLALADLIGLDVLLDIMETLYKETADSKYRPCPLLKKKVRIGDLGKKTGKGFYEYE